MRKLWLVIVLAFASSNLAEAQLTPTTVTCPDGSKITVQVDCTQAKKPVTSGRARAKAEVIAAEHPAAPVIVIENHVENPQAPVQPAFTGDALALLLQRATPPPQVNFDSTAVVEELKRGNEIADRSRRAQERIAGSTSTANKWLFALTVEGGISAYANLVTAHNTGKIYDAVNANTASVDAVRKTLAGQTQKIGSMMTTAIGKIPAPVVNVNQTQTGASANATGGQGGAGGSASATSSSSSSTSSSSSGSTGSGSSGPSVVVNNTANGGQANGGQASASNGNVSANGSSSSQANGGQANATNGAVTANGVGNGGESNSNSSAKNGNVTATGGESKADGGNVGKVSAGAAAGADSSSDAVSKNSNSNNNNNEAKATPQVQPPNPTPAPPPDHGGDKGGDHGGDKGGDKKW